jgi:hypothetical protein
MWQRRPVAQALTDMIDAATAGTVYVHSRPPETVNPLAVVIGDTTREPYATTAFGTDDVDLAVLIVGGIEQNDDVDDLRHTVRQTILGDSTLKGSVQTAWPVEARGWRNMTGAGGIQLLYVELIVTIQM